MPAYARSSEAVPLPVPAKSYWNNFWNGLGYRVPLPGILACLFSELMRLCVVSGELHPGAVQKGYFNSPLPPHIRIEKASDHHVWRSLAPFGDFLDSLAEAFWYKPWVLAEPSDELWPNTLSPQETGGSDCGCCLKVRPFCCEITYYDVKCKRQNWMSVEVLLQQQTNSRVILSPQIYLE